MLVKNFEAVSSVSIAAFRRVYALHTCLIASVAVATNWHDVLIALAILSRCGCTPDWCHWKHFSSLILLVTHSLCLIAMFNLSWFVIYHEIQQLISHIYKYLKWINVLMTNISLQHDMHFMQFLYNREN